MMMRVFFFISVVVSFYFDTKIPLTG